MALRVGNWIVDGIGVSRPGPFLAHWRCTFDDMHEVRLPATGGLMEVMRPRGEGLLDSAALELDLVSLGVMAGRSGPPHDRDGHHC